MDSINPTLANLVGERCGQDALAIIKESDLRIAGKRLEHFCSFAGTLAAPEKAIEALWYVINSYSVVNRDFTAPDNHGWLICPPERLTATYLSIVSTSYNLSELAALGHKMQVEFGPTAPCCVNCDDLSAFLDSLNQKYQFSDILFSRQRSVFMLLNQNYKGVPGAVNYYYYSDAKLTRPHIEFYARVHCSRWHTLRRMGCPTPSKGPVTPENCFNFFPQINAR